MSDQTKTHWKKVVSDPNFIGEGDFQEGQEIALTIKHVNQSQEVVTAEGKSKKAVVHFAEPGVKPMILNVARSKAIEKVSGSGFMEDWPGVKIQLYIEHGIKAFGEVVSAVRVRPYKPRVQTVFTPKDAPEPVPKCESCGEDIVPSGGKSASYIAAYTKKKYFMALCSDCAQKVAAVATAQAKTEDKEETDDGNRSESDTKPDDTQPDTE